MDKDILNTFYNYIIPGALKGEIDCDFLVHILFNVTTPDYTLIADNKYDIENIPCLNIENYDEFNNALIAYVKKALPFYEDALQRIDKKYHIAYIIALSFVQMGKNDYKNPVKYYTKKTKALDTPLNITNDFQNYEYNSLLKSNIFIKIDKETPNEEAPFKFMILLNNEDGEYSLQTIRFYIIDDIVYIGAIQHEKLRKEDNKKAKRALYKANENVDEQPLMEINPGSVVAFTIFMSYMNANNYYRFKTCPENVQRKIDKKIHAYTLEESLRNNEYTEEGRFKICTIISRANGYLTKHSEIVKNLNTVLARIRYHFDITYFLEDDESQTSELITEDIISCNNKLLKDLYTQIQNMQKGATLK